MMSLSMQQAAFYSNNRYLEIEELLTEPECKSFFDRMEKAQARDLWRKNPPLKELLLSKKMARVALQLTGKSKLQLACDQWFCPDFFRVGKKIKFKELFSIQGIQCVFLLQLQPGNVPKPAKTPTLGLFPFPQGQPSENCQGSALIVNSDLLMSWPDLSTDIGLYAVAYSSVPAVYVQNNNDPATHFLKQFGYSYGDLLKNDTHPIII